MKSKFFVLIAVFAIISLQINARFKMISTKKILIAISVLMVSLVSHSQFKVFLQGAYSTSLRRHKDITTEWVGAMNAGTGGNALSQPYSGAPFNYLGTESVDSFPPPSTCPTDILDWVLLELRKVDSPAVVISNGRRAAFVREDGMIVDLDGFSDVSFSNNINNMGLEPGSYLLVIRHRNHLAVRTSNTITVYSSGGVSPYYFTTDQSQAFQVIPSPTGNAAMKDTLVSAGHYFLLWGGNANGMTTAGAPAVRATGPGSINDYAFLTSPAVLPTLFSVVANKYHPADMNMDGTIRATGPAPINDYSFLINAVLGSVTIIITQHQ